MTFPLFPFKEILKTIICLANISPYCVICKDITRLYDEEFWRSRLIYIGINDHHSISSFKDYQLVIRSFEDAKDTLKINKSEKFRSQEWSDLKIIITCDDDFSFHYAGLMSRILDVSQEEFCKYFSVCSHKVSIYNDCYKERCRTITLVSKLTEDKRKEIEYKCYIKKTYLKTIPKSLVLKILYRVYYDYHLGREIYCFDQDMDEYSYNGPSSGIRSRKITLRDGIWLYLKEKRVRRKEKYPYILP